MAVAKFGPRLLLSLLAELLKDPIHLLIVHLSDHPKHVWSLKHSHLNDRWHSACHEQQLVLKTLKCIGQCVDEILRRIVAELQAFLFDLRDIADSHTHFFRQLLLRQPSLMSKLSDSLAEPHCQVSQMIAQPLALL